MIDGISAGQPPRRRGSLPVRPLSPQNATRFAATLHQDARVNARHPVDLSGTLRDEDRRPYDVSVDDLSLDGFRAVGLAGLTPGTGISIGLPGLGMRGALVIRAGDGRYGCRFRERLSPAELSATMAAVAAAPVDLLARQDAPRHTPSGRAQLSVRQRITMLAALVAASWTVLAAMRSLLG